MSEVEDKAARVGHPLSAADASGTTGVYRMALTGALQSWAIPSAIRGKFVTITVCSNDDVQLAFGAGSAPALALNQLSALGTGHVGAGKTVLARTSLDRRVPGGATHLSVISTGTNGGFLELECSEQFS